ncbi:poly-gamma-glutamate synthase PgsB [Leptospira interrogans serovar Canicola]|nr:poly-gamma-glutamate synthase PgsB [Leptospira interrogans serovar Canicola]
MSFFILSFLFLVFCAFLFLEKKCHGQILKRIPIRIHVNGTRGKSSVTRLIHSILVEEGWKVLAKSTGSTASLLFPNRSESFIFRNKISIEEQKSFLRFAVNNDTQAIVLECMAVQPQYQRDSEELLICATHGVITNIRPDHWEWTDTEEKILEGFKKTIPNNGILIYGKNYIAESSKPNWNPSQKSKLNLSLLEAASLKNTKLILAEPELSKNQIETAFGYIRYPEHYENVEIAVRVCETLGVSSKSILRGITNTVSDPGALKILEKEVKGKRQRFVFAFAANDVVSFEKILKSDQKNWSEFDSIILVFNSKQERPFRTIEFGKFLTDFSGLSKIYFFGSWQKLFRSVYEGNADLTFYKKNIIFNFKEIFSKSNLWIGAGNYQGFGRVWLEKLAADLNVIEGKGWKS